MDTTEPIKKAKPADKSGSSFALRVRRETKRRVMQELAKVNKKDFGRKVTVDDLIGLAVSLLNAAHLTHLQERSLSNADRLKQRLREYVKKHGAVSKDEFLGMILGDQPDATVPDAAAQ